jgi:class 3 adenylate cyclase
VEAERRQVTILFTDMVGFTAFSEKSGEEAAFRLMQDVARLTGQAVLQEGGVVQGFTGDGTMAVFGAPRAYEDAPVRACRSALAILDRIEDASNQLERKFGVRPQVRIGINTGLAVVGEVQEGAGGGVTVMGDAVNVAARLQSLAEPGTIYISDATRQLTQGQIEATLKGEHQLKGKAEPLKVYELTGLRSDRPRFALAVQRGLSTYVGREREVEVLRRNLAASRRELRVVDIVAEPGMGKSRLLHEFRQSFGETKAVVLTGNCTPDARQTPFLPFIEVVRDVFRITSAESEAEVARRIESSLTALGVHSEENLGLLLNLLGFESVGEALFGLDGVLIGQHTRDLLQDLLAAYCRSTPVVLSIEDLHWIDSGSQELLGRIADDEAKLPLLVLHTRRPEFDPPWRNRPAVTTLPLEPLPASDIRRLIQARLAVEALPDALIQQVTERAEGNALFTEEMLTFLTESGALRTGNGNIQFDANAVAAALPASLQSLLTARIDRLSPHERSLLQAAAVIGRHFDPELLVAVANDANDMEAKLAAARELDLIHLDGSSGSYAFKHALVRDALVQTLLSEPRARLHLRIAEEIERRSGNRLGEVAERLAHHFSQTERADKAFTYLAMAAGKGLGVYAFDEADRHFATALALLDKTPDCASDKQVVELLADFTLFSHLAVRYRAIIEAIERFGPRIKRLGDNAALVQIYHQYVLALLWSGRYADAQETQKQLSKLATSVGDPRSIALALASDIHVSTNVAPYTIAQFEELGRQAIAAACQVEDSYLQYFLRFAISWEEIHRGRILKANEIADEAMAIGRRNRDSRSMGLGLATKAWIALTSDNYGEALNFAEAALEAAYTPWDRIGARGVQIYSRVLLRRPGAYELCRDFREECAANGWHWYWLGAEGMIGVAAVLAGKIRLGLKRTKEAIAARDKEGYRASADWTRLALAEIYVEIIEGREKPAISILAKNMLALAKVFLTAEKHVKNLIAHVKKDAHFDPNGHHIGRSEMLLGLMYKAKKKHVLALQHLTEAHRISAQYGPTPLLARIERALSELSVVL